jgi:hypothetical protein
LALVLCAVQRAIQRAVRCVLRAVRCVPRTVGAVVRAVLRGAVLVVVAVVVRRLLVLNKKICYRQGLYKLNVQTNYEIKKYEN